MRGTPKVAIAFSLIGVGTGLVGILALIEAGVLAALAVVAAALIVTGIIILATSY